MEQNKIRKINDKESIKILKEYEGHVLKYESIGELINIRYNKSHRIGDFYKHVYLVLDNLEKIYYYSYKRKSKNMLYLCIGGPLNKTMKCKDEAENYLFFNNSDGREKISGILVYRDLINS